MKYVLKMSLQAKPCVIYVHLDTTVSRILLIPRHSSVQWVTIVQLVHPIPLSIPAHLAHTTLMRPPPMRQHVSCAHRASTVKALAVNCPMATVVMDGSVQVEPTNINQQFLVSYKINLLTRTSITHSLLE